MIDILTTSASDLIEIRLSGQITQPEYDAVIVPAIEKGLADHDRLRVLVLVDPGFTGVDMGAAWSDTKMGLSHWRGFDRIAVATDIGWMKVAVRAMAPVFPCPVQVFGATALDDARLWLRESLGTIHVTELGGAAVQIQLLGKLDPEAFARAQDGLSAHMRAHDGLRLLLDLREFDGWQGLSALAAHLQVARANVGAAERIALVGDKTWQRMAERVAARILDAETRFFEAGQFDAAKAWLTAA